MGKLLRSGNKKVGGVCAGVAEHFGWDVKKVRLVWFLLSILGAGAPVLCYFILWYLMPDGGAAKVSYEERMNKRLGR